MLGKSGGGGKERNGMEWKGKEHGRAMYELQRVRSILKEERKERGEKKGVDLVKPVT